MGFIIIIVIIIGVVIYFFSTLEKEERNKKAHNKVIEENIYLYTLLYNCMSLSEIMIEQPASLKDYMIFKRSMLKHNPQFKDLNAYNDTNDHNKFLDFRLIADYKLNMVPHDIRTIQDALKKSHDFDQFKNVSGHLYSSFRLINGEDNDNINLAKEKSTVIHALRERKHK